MRIVIGLLALAAALIGCKTNKQESMIVNITLRNDSTNGLDWVNLHWEGPHVPGGVLSPGIGKTSVSIEWPNVRTGKLTFVDDKTRKPYQIDLSFAEVNELVRSGKCRNVEIRILSYETARIACK